MPKFDVLIITITAVIIIPEVWDSGVSWKFVFGSLVFHFGFGSPCSKALDGFWIFLHHCMIYMWCKRLLHVFLLEVKVPRTFSLYYSADRLSLKHNSCTDKVTCKLFVVQKVELPQCDLTLATKDQIRAPDQLALCSLEYGQNSFRLPPSSPYDKFLKAAGCWRVFYTCVWLQCLSNLSFHQAVILFLFRNSLSWKLAIFSFTCKCYPVWLLMWRREKVVWGKWVVFIYSYIVFNIHSKCSY